MVIKGREYSTLVNTAIRDAKQYLFDVFDKAAKKASVNFQDAFILYEEFMFFFERLPQSEQTEVLATLVSY